MRVEIRRGRRKRSWREGRDLEEEAAKRQRGKEI